MMMAMVTVPVGFAAGKAEADHSHRDGKSKGPHVNCLLSDGDGRVGAAHCTGIVRIHAPDKMPRTGPFRHGPVLF
jgi:hypothetical protein